MPSNSPNSPKKTRRNKPGPIPPPSGKRESITLALSPAELAMLAAIQQQLMLENRSSAMRRAIRIAHEHTHPGKK